MKTIDAKELLTNLGIDKVLCKAFSKKLNKTEEELKEIFDRIVDKEINSIGQTFASQKFDKEKASRLQGLSLDELMENSDKIIKDE